jgi:hypothetical protein
MRNIRNSLGVAESRVQACRTTQQARISRIRVRQVRPKSSPVLGTIMIQAQFGAVSVHTQGLCDTYR